MDLLDILIVLLALGFAVSGYRRGISWVAPSIAGMFLGTIIGALAAPWIANHFAKGSNLKPAITAGVFFGLVFFVEGVGTAIGFKFRVATLRTRFVKWDSAFGGALAVIGVLITSWFVGLTFERSPWIWLNNQIAGSRLIRNLDAAAPQPPLFLLNIQSVIASGLPNALSSLRPLDMPQVDIPAKADSPGIQNVANNTARIVAYSTQCNSAEAGSGFAITTDYMVTNAHVVAGGDRFEVDSPDGTVHHDVTVVLYDPTIDVAILHVPHLGLAPLTILADDPVSGVTGAVVGYPGGGAEHIQPAAVRGTEHADGYTLYNDPVNRDIVVVASTIVQGNSGGPLVDSKGQVIGLVFATSTTDAHAGYALSIPEITSDLKAGVIATKPVATGACVGG